MFGRPLLHLAKVTGFVLLSGGILFCAHYTSSNKYTLPTLNKQAHKSQPASAVFAIATSSLPIQSTSANATTTATTTISSKVKQQKAPLTATKATREKGSVSSSTVEIISRLPNAYTTAPLAFGDINTATRGALVDILCQPRSGAFNTVSGSGVIIDPRGTILTNAHVAQYVLLSESSSVDLSCVIRSGSPATGHWTAQVLYIPTVWVNLHVPDINKLHPTGTGEHDYALLQITGASDGSPLPSSFAYISSDTRERASFLGDSVLGAGYPAEFIGGQMAQTNLYAASSVSTISHLFTFGTDTVDSVSIGGVIEAQQGSSGGAVVNAWGKLVGIITTTSDGATTAQRDLRAITLSYIDRDLQAQTGMSLKELLNGDLVAKVNDFTTNNAPQLLAPYLKILLK